MGMFDWVEVDVDGFDIEPDQQWQTKHRDISQMETIRLTDDGLAVEEREYYEVPEEERPGYDEEIGGFPSEMSKAMGSIGSERTGWNHWDDFHGRFEFHGMVAGEYRRFEATFTHGELESIDEVELEPVE